MRRSTGRRGPASKARGVILMIVGVGAIIWGVYSIGKTTASCGGQTMHAGDTCVETTNGVQDGAPRSISQQLADEHEDGWGGVAAGVVLLLLGGIVVVSKRGQRAPAGGVRSQASFPAGPPAAGGEALGQQPNGWPSGPGYAQPGNPGPAQQQGWGQQQQYPQHQDWGQQPQYPQQQGQPQYPSQQGQPYPSQQGWGQPQYPPQGQYPQR